jgi:hypothetical protein
MVFVVLMVRAFYCCTILPSQQYGEEIGYPYCLSLLTPTPNLVRNYQFHLYCKFERSSDTCVTCLRIQRAWKIRMTLSENIVTKFVAAVSETTDTSACK